MCFFSQANFTHRAIDEVTNVLIERLIAIAVEELTTAVGQAATEFSLRAFKIIYSVY